MDRLGKTRRAYSLHERKSASRNGTGGADSPGGPHTRGQLSFKEAMAGTLFTAAHPNMGLLLRPVTDFSCSQPGQQVFACVSF